MDTSEDLAVFLGFLFILSRLWCWSESVFCGSVSVLWAIYLSCSYNGSIHHAWGHHDLSLHVQTDSQVCSNQYRWIASLMMITSFCPAISHDMLLDNMTTWLHDYNHSVMICVILTYHKIFYLLFSFLYTSLRYFAWLTFLNNSFFTPCAEFAWDLNEGFEKVGRCCCLRMCTCQSPMSSTSRLFIFLFVRLRFFLPFLLQQFNNYCMVCSVEVKG